MALKIQSPDITHNTDVGGVLLNLQGRGTVLATARKMKKHVQGERPDARISSFSVEPMHVVRDGFELIGRTRVTRLLAGYRSLPPRTSRASCG